MVCWFAGTAIIAVWFVFRDPRFDYRLLVVGALVPELDGLTGGAGVLHTLVASVVVLVVVMLATTGRRRRRQLWLGLPIGTLLHLVFDGAWRDSAVFAWPLRGWSFGDAALPVVERGWWNVPLELVGIAILVWVWRTARLADPVRRDAVRRSGRLFEVVP